MRSLISFIALISLAAAGETYAWRNIDIRGMGFVTGVLAHPLTPNRVYIRTDVGGAYRYEPGGDRWTHITDGTCQSIESIAIDPKVADRVLVAAEGEVWRSDDAGAHWTATGLAAQAVTMDGNGDRRRAGERLQVDAAGSTSVLWLGTRNHGLWRKVGTGAWAKIAAVPVGTAGLGVTTVAVDNATAAGQASARTVYAGVTGQGVWRTLDGGATWAQIAGGPPTGQEPIRTAVASDGTLYLTCKGGNATGTDDYHVGAGSAWRLRAGVWTSMAPNTSSWGPIALDPTSPDKLLMATYESSTSNWIWRSDNAGASWTALPMGTPTVPASWASWHLYSWTGGLCLDTASPSRLWVTTGFGVLTTADHRAATPAWRAPMQGVEELVVMHLRALPTAAGGNLIAGVADMVGYTIAPASTGTAGRQWIVDDFGICTGMDYCEADPLTVAFVGSDENNSNPRSKLSRDGGLTWQTLNNPNPNASYAGVWNGNIAIACNDKNSFVWQPTTASWADNGKGAPGTWYTRNAGATWQKSTGGPSRVPPLDQHWFQSEVLISDRVTAGTFYMIVSNTGTGECWRSTDYGATWVKRSSALHGWSYKVKARAVPGVAGELWVSYANSDGGGTVYLHRSQDGGATWTDLTSIDRCKSLGFGAPAPGRTNPAAYLYATIGASTGIWRSDDATSLAGAATTATWTLISTPTVPLESVYQVEGDPSIYGQVYVATGGRGALIGQRLANVSPVISAPAQATPVVLTLP
jgi:xyloglucan-specific exo-beta-1,4-glucanase